MMKCVDSFKPSKGVWEITSACNMCCRHCGSGCGDSLPDELSTEAALKLADDLADLGLKAITLSGGEPFLRKDWHLIAARLTQHGILTNIITNGWLVTDELLKRAIDVQINNIALSLDGSRKEHDWLRKKGSYQKTLTAFKLLYKHHISAACVTTLNRRNISDLPIIKTKLIRHYVKRWQIQLAMPMGNLRAYPELVITAKELPSVIDFMQETKKENKIILHLGDNIGYYSSYNEESLRYEKHDEQSKQLNLCFCWQGCHAGKRIIGIRANGDIVGCLAIRDRNYIAGNIREHSLKEIWNQSEALSKLRNLKSSQLQGFCRTCAHGNSCLGGCSAQKIAFGHSIFAENPTCLYRFECGF